MGGVAALSLSIWTLRFLYLNRLNLKGMKKIFAYK